MLRGPDNQPLNRAPAFIVPESIHDFDDESFDAYLTTLRDVRLASVREFKEKQRMLAAERAEKAAAKVEKQFDMLQKEVDRAERVITSLEKRARNIRALRVELDIEDLTDES